MFQLLLFGSIAVLSLLMWIIFSRRREVDRIPGPRVYPIIGSLPDLIQISRLGVVDYLLDRQEKYGPIFRLSFLGQNFIFVSDPDYIKTVLTSRENLDRPAPIKVFRNWTGPGLTINTGDLWHKQRKLLEPVFSNVKIRLLIPRIFEKCEIMCRELRRFDGEEIDLMAWMRDLTLRMAYDHFLNIPPFDEAKHKEVASTTGELFYIMISRMVRPWLWKDSIYSLTKNASRENILAKKLRRITLEAISSRKNQTNENVGSENRHTLVDYMIECQKADASIMDEDIRAQVDTMISSVTNTLPLGLSTILYFLASYESVQDNIRRELNSVLPEPISSRRSPTMEELSRLTYLDNVINESLRFAKPPPSTGRYLDEELLIGPFKVPAGSTVFVNSFTLHCDRKYYSTPEKFNPEHFSPEEVARRPLYAFLPFGKALRSCIAERYARMCMKLVVASIIQNYRVKSSQSLHEMWRAQLQGLIKPGNASQSIIVRFKTI